MDFDTVFIDGDQLMYAVGFSSEGEPLSYCLNTVKQTLNKIQRDCGAEHRDVWIKGANNFRESVSVSRTYKANRTASKKPKYLKEIHDYLVEYQGAQEAHGMEADDMLSVLLFRNQKDCILYSQDKDLLNTPGWHMNPHKDPPIFDVTEEEAGRHFWYQMLAGDRVDNIPGLPELTKKSAETYDLKTNGYRCGEKRAWHIMNMSEYSELPQNVYNLYRDYFEERMPFSDTEMCNEYFVEQGKLLWMARDLHHDGSPVVFDPSFFELELDE
jgi:hypothetical protein